MNWKNFKTWLEENIVESEELKVRIKAEKQPEYGNISTITLTNFCDSLEVTLDKKDDCHLFPEFSDNKSFAELFEYQNCYFGKKTNQERISEVEYELLGKLFSNWKREKENDTVRTTDNNNSEENVNRNDAVSEVRNILLIGTTGSGKSTLANVLMGENRFRESSKSISITKNVEEETFEVELDEGGKEKIKYRVIDTIGIGDTKMKPQGVLMRLAEMADRVKREGLNQILFVTRGRFTKEEIEAYDLLSSIIFDKEVINYTTVVRTGFEEFEDKEACNDDRGSLRTENAALAHILGAVDIIYLDNPPIKGRAAEKNKEIREESRKRILTYLGGCRETYCPKNIGTLDERVQDYKTHEEKLKEKMKELEKTRKEQEAEFRKKLADLKEDQVKELRENRRKFEEDLDKVKKEGEENIRKVKDEMEDKQKKELEEHERRNKEREKENNARHKKDIEKLEKTIEEQKREQKEESAKNREKLEKLSKEELEIRKQELEIQKERDKREQDRLDKIAEADIALKKQQKEAEKTRADQEEKARKLRQEKESAGVFETMWKGGIAGWKNS